MVAVRNDAPALAPVTITDMRARVGDLRDTLAEQGYKAFMDKVRQRGIAHLSGALEADDPSDPQERAAGLDAWRRMLIAADIRTAGDRWGTYSADRLEKMGESDIGKALFPEFCRRVFIEAWAPPRQERAPAVYLSSDYAIGTIQRPYDDDLTLRTTDFEPAVPLGEVIIGTQPSDGSTFRSRYLVTPATADIRMQRVAEAAEIPIATITEGSRINRTRKFGRGIRASYEALRRDPLDVFAVYIRQLSLQTQVDQVGAAIDVMVNGDGNAGTSATSYNLTALDAGTTANNLTLDAWLAFKLKWRNPYLMTAVVGREAAIFKLLKLNVGTANLLSASQDVPAGLRQEFVPMTARLGEGIRYGITDDVAANTLVGFDGRLSVVRMLEEGSEISEAERWITRQVEVMTFSFNEGYRVFDPQAVRIINLAA